MDRKLSQCEKIIDYIERNGSITPLDALREFGCMRLASRISDLKRRGYKITREIETARNKAGEPISYARYSFREETLKEELQRIFEENAVTMFLKEEIARNVDMLIEQGVRLEK